MELYKEGGIPAPTQIGRCLDLSISQIMGSLRASELLAALRGNTMLRAVINSLVEKSYVRKLVLRHILVAASSFCGLIRGFNHGSLKEVFVERPTETCLFHGFSIKNHLMALPYLVKICRTKPSQGISGTGPCEAKEARTLSPKVLSPRICYSTTIQFLGYEVQCRVRLINHFQSSIIELPTRLLKTSMVPGENRLWDVTAERKTKEMGGKACS